MTNDFLERMSDFSFGVLLMTDLAGVLIAGLHASKHRLMKVTAAFLSWLLLVNVFYFIVYYVFAPTNLYFYLLCDILEVSIVPACLFLLLAITHPERLTRRLVAANALPYAAALVVFFIVRTPLVRTLVFVLPTLHAIGILVYAYRYIRDYNLSLLQVYSSLDNIDLKWTRYLVIVYAAWIALWLLENISPYNNYIDAVYDFFVATIVAITAYSMIRHAQTLAVMERNLSTADEPTEAPAEAIAAPDKPNGQPSSFDKRFEALFAEDKIYLNPILTIDELARALGSNRTYTSNYINQNLGTSFYNYVNSWRVRHAARLLQDSELAIEEVAGQSGFNSITSFRKYFRNVFGCSASEYKKRHASGQSIQNTDA